MAPSHNLRVPLVEQFPDAGRAHVLSLATLAAVTGTAALAVHGASADIALNEADVQALYWAALDREIAPDTSAGKRFLIESRWVVEEATYDVSDAFKTALDAGGKLFPSEEASFSDFIHQPEKAYDMSHEVVSTVAGDSEGASLATRGLLLGAAGVFSIMMGAKVLNKAKTYADSWLRPSTDAYYERRLAMLEAGRGIKDDIAETRERAALAIARLEAHRANPFATHIDPDQHAVRVDKYSQLPIKDAFDRIRALSFELNGERPNDTRLDGYAKRQNIRDVLREVVMDEMPDVVDPFAPAGPGAEGPGDEAEADGNPAP